MSKLVSVPICFVSGGHEWPTPHGATARDVIRWIEDKIALAPPEYRDSVTLMIGVDEDADSPSATIEMQYRREETAEEAAAREARVADAEKVQAEWVRMQEMDLLRQLRAKYPDV